MSDSDAIQVLIRNLAGEYLSGDGREWSFTADRALAHIFDYHADDVPAQLERAQRDLGVVWVAVPLNPRDVGEACDACGLQIPFRAAHFDGIRYLCPACVIRQKAEELP